MKKQLTMDAKFEYVVAAQSAWLLLLAFGTAIFPVSDFAARKLCHAGSGALMLLLDPHDWRARLFVHGVVVSSLAMTWIEALPAFRFGQRRDVGITIYLLLVAAWFQLELPLLVIAPVFFADPAGAVVGKWCSRHLGAWNPKINGEKTLLGSLAVFVVTLLSSSAVVSKGGGWGERLAVAAGAMWAELIGGDYDNLALAAIVLASWTMGGYSGLAIE